jgi:hypothetical protein
MAVTGVSPRQAMQSGVVSETFESRPFVKQKLHVKKRAFGIKLGKYLAR